MAGRVMHAVQYSSCREGPSDLKVHFVSPVAFPYINQSYFGGSCRNRRLLQQNLFLFQYVELPIPTPKKDEVLIKMEAASISPIDWKIQQGMLRPMLPSHLPCIPGTDVAGEIVEVGSGVKNLKAGDKVVAMLNFYTGGALAEFIAAKASLAVARPEEVSAAEVAGLPAAVQFVKSLGADEVVDCTTPEGAALKSPSGKKYDVVIHSAEPIPWGTFEPNLASNGKIFDVNPTLAAIKSYALKKLIFSKKQLIPVILSSKAENLDFLVKLVKEGKLKTAIDSKYSLIKAEDAWAKNIDEKTAGKIIVEP
ncbi:hypothetical protein CJ030_MR1G017496 [Morella rubra]|uniref:Enoyl reductase (ER) domain-containing protein n=1 Tax=Morella rubra TaxID=262757 RepID=A0A6A1WJN8_9ROSI|nr:hypothetical protein CJ030_MR1G017496 [Morella rubra]